MGRTFDSLPPSTSRNISFSYTSLPSNGLRAPPVCQMSPNPPTLAPIFFALVLLLDYCANRGFATPLLRMHNLSHSVYVRASLSDFRHIMEWSLADKRHKVLPKQLQARLCRLRFIMRVDRYSLCGSRILRYANHPIPQQFVRGSMSKWILS